MRPSAASDGFTLIEAVVALAIVGLTVVTMLSTISQVLRTQADALRQREAAALGDWKLNEIAVQAPESAGAYLRGRGGSVQLAQHAYAWRATIARDPAGLALWRATVTVGWNDRHLTLESVFHRREWTAVLGRSGATP